MRMMYANSRVPIPFVFRQHVRNHVLKIFKMAKESSQHQHKPGPLKQQNKSHKHGRHKTKGMVDTISKGSCLIYGECILKT